jgi:hypothetical protein
MGKEHIKDLNKFLKPFPNEVKETALWLREFIWDAYPTCNELIYDNYNALAVGFAPSDKAGDIFVSFAVYSQHVNLGFNRGSEISDPDKLLKGSGSLYRHVRVDRVNLPEPYITKLMKAAFANSNFRLKANAKINGQTIIKSIAAQKKRLNKK